MSITFQENLTLEATTCIKCGVTFAIPKTLMEALRRDSGFFHCPNGHSQGWGKSEGDRLREQLEQKERELRASKCEILNEQNLRISVEAEKEKAEKKLRRVKGGACPCCNRWFPSLAAHMNSKHSKS